VGTAFRTYFTFCFKMSLK